MLKATNSYEGHIFLDVHIINIVVQLLTCYTHNISGCASGYDVCMLKNNTHTDKDFTTVICLIVFLLLLSQ